MKDIFMAQKPTTIFRQLILNVVVPPILALLILGILNVSQTRYLLLEGSQERNYIISNEIFKVLEFQDVALNLVEENLDQKMAKTSNDIILLLENEKDLSQVNLEQVQLTLQMNPIMEDIYIIDTNGIVINTTFEEDLNLNFFAFGEEHQAMLKEVFHSGAFKKERFAIESKTKRLKKYSYQATKDQNYIIQIGIYSQEADEIIDFIKNTTRQIAEQTETVESVDLFIGEDNPFSLNRNAELNEKHLPYLQKAFAQKDTIDLVEKIENKRLHTQYIYMDRKNTDLYKGSVIQIVSDYSHDYREIRKELIKFLSIFSLTLLIIIVLIYSKTKVITTPIQNLVSKVNRITHGHLNERADIVGNNEITTLSKQFNRMIEELESYYNELEQKVAERTREIQQQNEEISAQRDAIEDQRNMLADKNNSLQDAYKEIEAQKDNITDSIVYAKRIQNAILPAHHRMAKLVPKHFVYYQPKDIVSGDFYWVDKIGSKSVIAAVDCTGHGVPGAFMSIVGHNQLDYATRIKKARSAGEILDALNEGVSNALQNERNDTTVKDGMDIAICVIDHKAKKIEYAGAYNPLYLVRNGELTKVKADKFAIGTYLDNSERKYTNHEIQLQEGDMVYIFSDGYADQFGGPKGRKFMYRNFQEYLIQIAGESLEKQKELLHQKHIDWRGKEIQIDDIIVIGFSV